MSQAAYMNGYDDGYEDARKELAKSGSSGGSASPVRAPKFFTIAEELVLDADSSVLPSTVTGISALPLDGTAVSEPDGGFVPGDILRVKTSDGFTADHFQVGDDALDVYGTDAVHFYVYQGPSAWVFVCYISDY